MLFIGVSIHMAAIRGKGKSSRRKIFSLYEYQVIKYKTNDDDA